MNKSPLIDNDDNDNEFIIDEEVDIIDMNDKKNTKMGKIKSIDGEILTILNYETNKLEKYNINSGLILKKWIPEKNKIKVYNTVDIRLKDKDEWVMGTVIDINNDSVLINYENKKFEIKEDWININSGRLAQSGAFSKMELYNYLLSDINLDLQNSKYNDFSSFSNSLYFLNKKREFSDEFEKQNKLNEEENKFHELLLKNNFYIKEVSGDGNCLFRSISDQVYGTDEHYKIIREKCMDYIEILKEYFMPYIEGDFDEYIKEKRKDKVWGDDVEIEALSEIYKRPIEIYNGNDIPIKSFHEDKYNSKGISGNNKFNLTPIRLSYQRGNHYNSIIPFDDDNEKYDAFQKSLIKQKPGIYEKKILGIAQLEESELKDAIKLSEESFMFKRIEKNLSEKIEDIVNRNESKLILKNKEKSIKIKKEDEIKNNNKNKLIEKYEEKDKLKEKEKEKEKNEEINNLENKRKEIIEKCLSIGFDENDILEAIEICGLDKDLEIIVNYITNTIKNFD